MPSSDNIRSAALNVAYAVRRRARADGGAVFEGPIVSEVPGRTDRHEMAVGAGSYVLPAESVSSLGENNTIAGLANLKKMGAAGISRLARSAKGAPGIMAKHRRRRASGGAAQDTVGHPVDIVAAGGEHVMSPEDVRVVGDGDVILGHALLDNWVLQNRQNHIATLRKLAPPAKD